MHTYMESPQGMEFLEKVQAERCKSRASILPRYHISALSFSPFCNSQPPGCELLCSNLLDVLDQLTCKHELRHNSSFSAVSIMCFVAVMITQWSSAGVHLLQSSHRLQGGRGRRRGESQEMGRTDPLSLGPVVCLVLSSPCPRGADSGFELLILLFLLPMCLYDSPVPLVEVGYSHIYFYGDFFLS